MKESNAVGKRHFLSAFFFVFLLQACTSSDVPLGEDGEGVAPFVKSVRSCQPPVSLKSFFGAVSQSSFSQTPYEAFEAGEFVVDGVSYSFYRDALEAELEQPRNVQYEFHAWFSVRAVLSQALVAEETDRNKMLLSLRDFAVDYAEKNRFADNDYRTQKAEGFHWYDMGVGLRALTLGAMLRVFACEDILDEAQEKVLHAFAVDHVVYLLAENFHSGHNNHGAFQSAGSIGLCSYYPVLPDCSALYTASELRLRAYFDKTIVGGVHTEHSTAYMVYVLDLLSAVSQVDGLTDDLKSYLNSQLTALSSQLQWFIAPDGSEVQIGDTDAKKFPVASLRKAPEDAVSSALWLASGGREGSSPTEDFWVSKDAGYAASRDVELGEYVLFTAAFHSRTHKHADDGNFLWFSDSKPILIDGGKYGYLKKSSTGSVLREEGFWYADPKRVFVESNRAHNVVEVDGKSTNRRTAIAYGSAIAGAAKNLQGATVFGMDLDRQEEVAQKRTVIHQSGRFVLVIDDLVSAQGEREFKQWFQFAPRFNRSAEIDHKTELYSQDGEVVRISGHGDPASSAVYFGQEMPVLQGWHSREVASFYPNYSVSLNTKGAHIKYFTLIEYFGAADKVSGNPSVSSVFKEMGIESIQVIASDGAVFEYELSRGDNYRIVSGQP